MGRREPKHLYRRGEAVKLLRSRYGDFGPTLANEKLAAVHELTLSVETVRKLMVEEGLWKPKAAKKPVIHQMRERRARYGELIQIDGSPHDWFEGRAAKCTLLVMIDDATSRLMQLRFAPAETTFSYFATVRGYIGEHRQLQLAQPIRQVQIGRTRHPRQHRAAAMGVCMER
jgi:hypothetical protein